MVQGTGFPSLLVSFWHRWINIVRDNLDDFQKQDPEQGDRELSTLSPAFRRVLRLWENLKSLKLST